ANGPGSRPGGDARRGRRGRARLLLRPARPGRATETRRARRARWRVVRVARRAPVAPRRRGPVPAEQEGAPGVRGPFPRGTGPQIGGGRSARPVGRGVGAAAQVLRGEPVREQAGVSGTEAL
ncbi:MAG: FIG01125063: hypothetical protein, partial [uncultured Rubrobacteraceae bacterium]